jgi:phosphate transport system protein
VDKANLGHHISEPFNKELEDIRNLVLTMGGLVEGQIGLAIETFIRCDVILAKQAIKQDNQIDTFEMAIDQECTQIIALRQPTAFDLRLLISTLKVINELERIGGLAAYIAKMAISRSGIESTQNTPCGELQVMATLVKTMLHDALEAFARLSIDRVPEIIDRDKNVYQEYGNIIKQQVIYMMEDPKNITRALNVLWTVRSLERIGDHACEICEHLLYLKGGNVQLIP